MSAQQLNKREKLLEAAIGMFNKSGLEVVGVRELALKMNMSAGNVTYYFPTKESLVYAFVESAHQAFISNFARPVDSLNDLNSFLKELFEWQFNYRALFISQGYVMSLNKEVQKSLQSIYSEMQAWLKKVINRCIQEGFFEKDGKKDPTQFRELLFVVLKFSCNHCIPSSNKLSKDAYRKTATKMFSSVLFLFLNKKGKAFLEKSL